jgi:hypothetical protein
LSCRKIHLPYPNVSNYCKVGTSIIKLQVWVITCINSGIVPGLFYRYGKTKESRQVVGKCLESPQTFVEIPQKLEVSNRRSSNFPTGHPPLCTTCQNVRVNTYWKLKRRLHLTWPDLKNDVQRPYIENNYYFARLNLISGAAAIPDHKTRSGTWRKVGGAESGY